MTGYCGAYKRRHRDHRQAGDEQDEHNQQQRLDARVGALEFLP